MSKYLRVMGLCFSVSIVLALLGFVTTVAEARGTPDGTTPSQEDVCDAVEGAAYGLCTAYCEAMDCESDQPNASDTACESVLAKYMTETDGIDPPCSDSCVRCGLPGFPACPAGEFCLVGCCVGF
jgi:hypothetical protein